MGHEELARRNMILGCTTPDETDLSSQEGREVSGTRDHQCAGLRFLHGRFTPA